jgi:hypothetical protein
MGARLPGKAIQLRLKAVGAITNRPYGIVCLLASLPEVVIAGKTLRSFPKSAEAFHFHVNKNIIDP